MGSSKTCARDAGDTGAAGPEKRNEDVEHRLDAPVGSRFEVRDDERRPAASGHKAEHAVDYLHLTLLDKIGVPVERFGDSEGKIDLVSCV